jgi:hypothetical protein
MLKSQHNTDYNLIVTQTKQTNDLSTPGFEPGSLEWTKDAQANFAIPLLLSFLFFLSVSLTLCLSFYLLFMFVLFLSLFVPDVLFNDVDTQNCYLWNASMQFSTYFRSLFHTFYTL